MKRDGRTLDHATLETIRLMAVERVLEGEVASAVITSYGFNRTTIYKWLTAAAKPGVGLRALQARPAPGRPRRLTLRLPFFAPLRVRARARGSRFDPAHAPSPVRRP